MVNVEYTVTSRKVSSSDPRRIGLWKIGREIGSGASGRVKIARHTKTGQHAAVKIVSKIFLNSRVSLNRMAEETEHNQLAIEREIVIMKLLDHPNIMRLYDVWETSTELYLILEYVQGGELFEHLCNKGKLPVAEALNYFQQIIAAMDYCHKFNIAHRDLKPENILLDQNFNIKIADFGMAAWQATNDGMLRTSCGSPHYAAPEIISGNVYNGSAADIWSCGVILFALLAGKLPFDDEDCVVLLEKVKHGEYEMPADMNKLAQDLVKRMLCRDVLQRITMPEIMAHPFFNLHPPKELRHSCPQIGNTVIDAFTSIDPDIFANLRTLWHGTPDEQLINNLMNNKPTLQKGVYRLLVMYRATHLQGYNDEEQIIWDHLERKKSKKAKAMAPKGLLDPQLAEVDLLPSSLPPRDGPPTPRRASGRDCSSTRSSSIAAGIHATQPPTPTVARKLSSCNGEVLPLLTVPELEDDQMQVFFSQIVQRLNVLQARAAMSEHGTLSPNLAVFAPVDNNLHENTSAIDKAAGRGEQAEEFHVLPQVVTKPLSVKRRQRRLSACVTTDGDKENIGEDFLLGVKGAKKKSLKSKVGGRLTLGTKRIHIIDPTMNERSRAVKGRSKASASSTVSEASAFVGLPSEPFSLPLFSSSSPKRTWLGNVFGFRASRLNLFSLADIYTTRNECQRLLVAMSIHVSYDGNDERVLKCRLEEVKEASGVMNVLKAVKFRVEFQAPQLHARRGGEAVMTSLTLIHEKGSTETFREVCRRLENQWTLNEIESGS